jgi:hypothetical protein
MMLQTEREKCCIFFRKAPQQMLRTHRSLKAYCATLLMKMKRKMISVFIFPRNWAPMEWNWQGKTEVLGEKPVPMPLCPPRIPHGLTRDGTRASAMGGRRLTAWAMAWPSCWGYIASMAAEWNTGRQSLIRNSKIRKALKTESFDPRHSRCKCEASVVSHVLLLVFICPT